MKKAAILIAAFYLLLITGAYACIVSCGSNHLKELLTANAATKGHTHDGKEKHTHDGKEKHTQGKTEKHCDGDEDCSCCKKHGNYTVKENIKPDNNFQVLEIPPITVNSRFLLFFSNYSFDPTVNQWPKSHAPPPPDISPPIFIKLHSLLI